MVCDRPVFREAGWEEDRRWAPMPAEPDHEDLSECSGDSTAEAEEKPVSDRAQRRARAAVREIARCNRFSWFVTLTLDRQRIDRYDMRVVTKTLNQWLDNQVRRKGLAYVLVPERHKDGAIHFHGFFNDALEAVPSGHRDRQGHEVFNLPGWTLGFTAAIRLYGDYGTAVSYVAKYIGKQGDKPGGRWYYSGGALRRPEVLLCDLGPEDAPPEAYRFRVEAAGLGFAMWTLPGENGTE